MHKDKSHQEFRSLPLGTLFRTAARNLLTKKLRSALTLAGIVIGIGTIFFLLSFGFGLRNVVTGEVIGNASIKTIDVASPNSRIVKIDRTNIDRIRGLPHVTRVGATYSFPGIVQLGSSEIDSVVYGLDNNYQDLLGLDATDGRLLQNDDSTAAVVNRSALKALGVSADKDAVGQKFTLTVPLDGASQTTSEVTQEFTIVGVIESDSGSEVFIPSFVFENAGVTTYTQAKVSADESENVAGLRSQIESLGLLTTSPADTIDQINEIFSFFNLVLIGFGAIGMIVAILGMFNTLTISLLERTREVGLMVAMGARRRDIRLLFIIEALLLSAVGAMVGITVAMWTSTAVNTIMNFYAHQRGVEGGINLFSTPLWLMAALIVFMMFVGLGVAYFPARRAGRINPIDALRRE